MTFREWIYSQFGKYGGYKRAAAFLGAPVSTVYSWASLARFPQPEDQELIQLKSGGEVSLDKWRSEFLAAKRRRKNKENAAC